MKVWVRTCQECGHHQRMKPPIEYKDSSWRDLKCHECGSSALDYGSDAWNFDNGILTRDSDIEGDEDDEDEDEIQGTGDE